MGVETERDTETELEFFFRKNTKENAHVKQVMYYLCLQEYNAYLLCVHSLISDRQITRFHSPH